MLKGDLQPLSQVTCTLVQVFFKDLWLHSSIPHFWPISLSLPWCMPMAIILLQRSTGSSLGHFVLRYSMNCVCFFKLCPVFSVCHKGTSSRYMSRKIVQPGLYHLFVSYIQKTGWMQETWRESEDCSLTLYWYKSGWKSKSKFKAKRMYLTTVWSCTENGLNTFVNEW